MQVDLGRSDLVALKPEVPVITPVCPCGKDAIPVLGWLPGQARDDNRASRVWCLRCEEDLAVIDLGIVVKST